jgi:hypothetical protein
VLPPIHAGEQRRRTGRVHHPSLLRSSWCRRWLDPVDGADLRISLRGAAVAGIVYAASLTVFATVEWLQYWT